MEHIPGPKTAISQTFSSAAIREAMACLGADAGDLNEELYTEFARNGNRVHYEGVNFHRRRLLNRLALGELCEGKGRFLPELSKIIACTLEEASWVLPAHSGGRLPVGAEENIDLFSSQTAAALAMISVRLPFAAPLQKRIWEAIDARIFVPFLTHDYWWRDLGKNRRVVPSNWIPWCIHGVLECVRAVMPDALPWCDDILGKGDGMDAATQGNRIETASPASFLPKERLPQLHEIAQSCLASLNNYFSDYPDDGGCDEGAQYWEHSVGHFFECGLFQEFDTTKFSTMCSFIRRVHMTGNYYMNFADCAARILPNASMVFLMGRKFHDMELEYFGKFLSCAQAAKAPDPTLRDNMDFRAILNAALASDLLETQDPAASSPLQVHSLLHPVPQQAQPFAPCPVLQPYDSFASLCAGIFRNPYFCVAAKGGHNGENHNHNDCGNVIIYGGGRPVLIDVGVGAYTKDTFSERRYTIWTMQSSYHNLPEINGCMQRDGSGFFAKNTVFSENEFSCELSAAYPQEAGLASYQRSVKTGEKCVKLISQFFFEHAKNHVCLNYMLAEKPQLADCRALIGGCLLKLPDGKWSVETIEFGEDEKLSPVWGHCVYRLRGEIDVPENHFTAVTIVEPDMEKYGNAKKEKMPAYTVVGDPDVITKEELPEKNPAIVFCSAADASDLRFMQEAIAQAGKAAAAGDVPIGCVITHGEEIIAAAYNMRNQQSSVLAHAETLAIEEAAKKCGDFRLEDCTLYVTLEPCPMCAGAIVQARIPRVVIGTMNPKAGCAGSILNILQTPRFNHQCEVVTGVCRKECGELLRAFFRTLR